MEKIVRGLEGGQQRLEDAISAYERGSALRALCEAKLAQAEQRVQAIVAAADGSLCPLTNGGGRWPSCACDQLLVDRGLVESRSRAQAVILAGKMFSGERRIDKAGQLLAEDAPLELRGQDHPWVSRGGLKLAHAMERVRAFGGGPGGARYRRLDRGFTDVLLAAWRGAGARGGCRAWPARLAAAAGPAGGGA